MKIFLNSSSAARFAVIILLALLAGWSCRRTLEMEPTKQIALVPISIDWTESGLLAEGGPGIFHASVWFFPENGDKPLVTILEGDHIKGDIITLPIGVYSVLVFNEKVPNQNDPSSKLANISFRGTDKWSTFEAYVGVESKYMAKNESKIEILSKRAPPSSIASWGLERFAVTSDMVAVTRMQASTASSQWPSNKATSRVDDELNKLVNVTPQPRTHSVKIQAKIENLQSAGSIVMTMSGAVEGVFLASGQRNLARVSHPLGIPKANWELNPDVSPNGTVHGDMLVFGLSNESVDLILDFVLINGQAMEGSSIFDISDQAKKTEQGTIVINIGLEERPNTDPDGPPHDKPIVLPDVKGKEVTVDEWGNVDIIIK